MPLYDYVSDCGTRFEKLVESWRTPNPPCPHCGGPTRRAPSRISMIGAAAPPPGDTGAPTSWEGTGGGDRATIAHWRRRLETRRAFEERHPEHATRREAIAAHEGVFERTPLTYRELAGRAAESRDATQGAAAAAQERTKPTTAPADR
ncbi:zinc ribbon domain-containing protein [Amycolatopsis cynarae]|uniref:Zinc ribbon domain-containing protein n=1 Tax=Amycolatopsis cynarae TaxID=2995223 RepID=A0ABY7BAX5_9PSEU|nr:zinc ribbon domain-containing protein [Amycolatopsis sp. HUAS 11-8]WAL68377.1 zinc ribbon domain-containing protein [Amycolatopsis sp. HUAS 11-8]